MRQREKHERIRESRVEGEPGEKKGGKREGGKSGKRFQVGKDEETQIQIAPQNRQAERERM